MRRTPYQLHIRRDGQSLCRNTKDGITWTEALNRRNLNQVCCHQCLDVFYTRLKRTLTIIPV